MGKKAYKLAPTWLFNLDGETKLFKTQEEVDEAWEEGWFGPKGIAAKTPLITQREADGEFETKRELKEAVEEDPRYKGLQLNLTRTLAILLVRVVEFEHTHDMEEVVVEVEE